MSALWEISQYCFYNKGLQPGSITQQVVSPTIHKVLSLIPSPHHKNQHGEAWLKSQYWGGGGRRVILTSTAG